MTTTAPVLGLHRELHVRAAGLDADLAHDRLGGVAQLLVLAVGQRLRRRDGDRCRRCGRPSGRSSRWSRRRRTLSARSRITSSSNSFQPSTDSSTQHLRDRAQAPGRRRRCVAARRGRGRCRRRVPPSVKDGRTTSGRPSSSAAVAASARSCTMTLRGTRRPISSIACGRASGPRRGGWPRASRRSARPPSGRARPPPSSSTARFSAVWPPSVGSSASGRSTSMMRVERGEVERLDVRARRRSRGRS